MVRRFDVLYIEDLNLRGMLKNHSLARALSDASIGQAIRLLEEKAERYGKRVERIDRWYPSSKTCSACGHIQTTMPLSVRDWTCPSCGTHHDRDVNAAVNIIAVGQTVSAHGGTVRRSRATASARKPQRSANQQAATSG
jgi:putative transposase